MGEIGFLSELFSDENVDMYFTWMFAFIFLILLSIAAAVISMFIGKFIKKMTFLEEAGKKIGVLFSIDFVALVVKKGVFILLFLLILTQIFSMLELDGLKHTLDVFMSNLPQYFKVALLTLLAWVLAQVAKHFSFSTLKKYKADEKLGKGSSESIAKACYGLVIVFFLPAILQGLGLNEISQPVEGLIEQVISYLPNIVSAVIIFVIALFIARLVRQITESVLVAAKVDAGAKKLGLAHTSISRVAGALVYIIILVPLAISALDRLQIEAISTPAKNMLDTIMNAVPGIIAAFLLLSVSFVIAQFITKFVADFLQNAGFDSLLKKIGLDLPDTYKLSEFISKILFSIIMILAIVEAGNMMNLTILSELLTTFLVFGGSVLGGIIMIFIGLIVANFAQKAMSVSSKKAGRFVKVVIILLSVAIGLELMGVGSNIVYLAFALGLGSIAVAFALAVGLGSKEVAAKHLEKFLSGLK